MKIFIFILVGFFAVAANADKATTKLCRGFLPPNNMWIPDDGLHVRGIEKDKFDDILDRIQAEFSSDISRRGGTLKIERRWSDGTVNAYADRAGRVWSIHMYGGFARHSAVTYDGFAMVACHEIGHHIGGAPHYAGDWASNEGQSDYFAPLKCLRRLFKNDDNRRIVEQMNPDPIAVSRCASQHGSSQDYYICIRATMAALALGKVLVEDTGKPEPRLDTPDPKVVSKTFSDHPEGQCRVDGMFQAALCQSNMMDDLSNSDYRVASCTSYEEDGARVRCWFNPTE